MAVLVPIAFLLGLCLGRSLALLGFTQSKQLLKSNAVNLG